MCFFGKRWLYLVYIFLSAQVYSGSLELEKYPIEFENYTTENGLIHNSANEFVQDKEGFLWIASNGGLERFDGYNFTVYKPSQDDTGSIKGIVIWSVYVDHNGVLWVGTMGEGLNRYNRDSDSFTNFRHNPDDSNSISGNNVSRIFEDKSGNLWLTTRGGGVDLFNRTTGRFTHFVHTSDENSLRDNEVHNYCLDNDGNIWLATEKGISILNPVQMKVRNYFRKKGDLDMFNSMPVLSLLFETPEKLWIGTWLNGLYTIDLSTFSIKKYIHDASDKYSIAGNVIWDIFKDSKGNIWIGTISGLSLYDPFKADFHNFLYDPNDPKSIAENYVRKIFEDRQGVLWFGTNNGGISKLDLYRKKFQRYRYRAGSSDGLSCNSVTSICDDYKGRIWVGTCHGLDRFDEDRNTFRYFFNDIPGPGDQLTNSITCITRGTAPYIWIGGNNGFSRFNTDTHTFVNYLHNNNSNSLSNNAVFSLFKDKDGILWIGTFGGGLDRYDTKTGIFRNFIIDSTNIQGNAVLYIYDDGSNHLYLGTYGHGMIRFDKKSYKMTFFLADPNDSTKLKDNVVLYIYQRNKREIWVCTAGGGVSVFDPVKGTFRNYDVDDGLPTSEIKGILEDHDENLWLSTGKGLVKAVIDDSEKDDYGEKVTFINFDQKDGLQSNDFNAASCYMNRKGEMFYGGINGMNVFNSDSIKLNPFKPNVVITKFLILNKPVTNGEKVNGRIILKKPITETKEIVLTHKEYVISFEFASLNFSSPEKNKYQYKLENFQTDWIPTDASRRFVTYSNLKPGQYIFRVRGTNGDGVWSNKEASVKLIVLPPWWKTWWFRLIYIMSILLMIGSILMYRYRRVQQQQLMLRRMVDESTHELQYAYSELKERQEEITVQKEELENHRNHLSRLVEERTRDLEQALKKAEESDKLKTSFLANMSHEIRTPMNAIVGFASLLKEYDLDPEERIEYIDVINKNCDSLLVLINDILDISKIEANQIEVYPAVFNVSNALMDIENSFKVYINEDIELKFIQNEDNLLIYNDPTRFRQIVSNLITNALKYTEKGHIYFGYEVIDNADMVRFFVEDTGVGIKESEFEIIFEQFRKIDFGESRLYRGAGLGLSICRSLVRKMGGDIWVKSELGKGSAFYFTLPMARAVQLKQTGKIAEENVVLPNLMGVTILIAEDEDANFEYIKQLLVPSNANIIWAKNGEEVVKMAKDDDTNKIALILMDIKMPLKNGIDAFKEIKEFRKDIYVIAQSAYAQEINIQSARDMGFEDYLTKPIKPRDFRRAIHRFFNTYFGGHI